MANAQVAAWAFFPLDEELALLPGSLTPSLQEDVVRLGAWMPFAKAAEELEHFRRTRISRTVAQRLTETAGAAYVAWQEAALSHIERKLPPAPEGVERLFLSVDGAMVPLVGGEWAEVKTLVIGEVQAPIQEKGQEVVHTRNHSYYSRLSDAQTFQQQALVETHKRGVENAESVVAVSDGAEWIQKFIDHHRYDALRILDFPHAAERLNAIAQLIWGETSEQATAWFAEQRHQLKQEGPEPVLEAIRLLIAGQEASPELISHLNYLEKRVELMRYPQFQAAGWPIGDGAVESGNKLVVEARLKGSGMHWARHNVDPMLALRNIVCSDRWDQAWSQIARMQRHQAHKQQRQRRQKRLLDKTPTPTPPPPPVRQEQQPSQTDPAPKEPWRPPADHPWRRMPVGRARFKRQQSTLHAKI